MNPSPVSNSIALLFLCFASLAAADIAINCGSSGNPALINGREWQGDMLRKPSSVVQLKGSSTTSTILSKKSTSSDEVPYTTARISQFRFYYAIQLNPGQKIIRFHFKPALYKGFNGLRDFFTVEAGAFTLLGNFSASLTAESLGVNYFVKEFCLYLQEDEQLSIVFYPATSLNAYAFVNGIEIISGPSSVSYYHGGDTGVHLVGQKFQMHVDYRTALERIHRLISKQTFVQSAGGDFEDMLPIRATQVKNSMWRVPVDIGFRYLIRLHLSELGLKIARSGEEVFKIFIDEVVVDNNAVPAEDKDERDVAWYVDCIVMMRGQKEEIKHDLVISVKPCQELIVGHDLLAAIEILKLSNPDNSLAGPNPLPQAQVSPHRTIMSSLSVLGRGNVAAAVVVIIISLVNILVQKLGQISEANSAEGGMGPSIRARLGEISEGNSAKEENRPSVRVRVCRSFSLDEIKLATGNFRELIGKGGFGKVYKGAIDNGRTTVAVKRLKPKSSQGTREFLTEIEALSELRHFNLISLIGYCNERREMILVYEYMVGGTLADHLYKLSHNNANFPHLNWNQRLNICIGAARGLDYLHTGIRLIHRDVKASNILLDENFVAKVSDFGLAKYEDRSKLRSHVSTKVKGTRWYLDPHYITTKKLTRQSDTYAFGVVMLETLCGRPAEDFELIEDEQILIRWARNNIGKGSVDKIVDSNLRDEISKRSLKAFVGLAERCLDGDPKKRPTMAQVVLQLESVLEQPDESRVLEINEIATVSSQDLNPPPIEQTTFKETANANELLLTTKELKDAKTAGLARFLPWNIRWSQVKLSRKDELFAGTSLYIKSKITHFFQRRWKMKDTIPTKAWTSVPLPIALCQRFSLWEILTATCNFDDSFIIGRGGFGYVYKGRVDNGATIVAVKRLNASSKQGACEFFTEIDLLSKLRHVNLVSLIGYCYENLEMILVYDYVERGTLHYHLFNSENSPLQWKLRLQICLGAARGLHYLHDGSFHCVIHRDIKSTNILLDHNMVAKLSDFGLSKLGPNGNSTHVSTLVKGSFGYIDPEYYKTSQLTEKSDVYSFGVVLFEVLCARSAIDRSVPIEQCNLANWVRTCHREGNLDQIIDSTLEGQIAPDCLKKFVDTAIMCVQERGADRPAMADVLWNLEFALQLQEAADNWVRSLDLPTPLFRLLQQSEQEAVEHGGRSLDLPAPPFGLLGQSEANRTWEDSNVFSKVSSLD